MRLPDNAPTLCTLYTRDGGGGMRRATRTVDAGGTNTGREFRTRAYDGSMLRGRMEATIEGCTDYSRRVDHTVVAGKHWSSRWRHFGLARPCLHSRRNRYTHAIRPVGWIYAATSRNDIDTATAVEDGHNMGRENGLIGQPAIATNNEREYHLLRRGARQV